MELALSIVVPVYNVEKYIRPCVESIFRQGLAEDYFEVIIVNDGSIDRSMEVIADIIPQHQNITIIHQKNQGLSVARNKGIAAAKGEYILMPDSDDLLIENSLRPLLEKAIETKVDVVVADFLKMSDEEIAQLENTPPKKSKENTGYIETSGPQLFMDNIMPDECFVWRSLFRRLFIVENNITFYPGIAFQDVPFSHEIFLKAGKCLRTHRLLNIYRRGHKSASSPTTFNMKKAHDFCIAIRETWKLNNVEGLSLQLFTKLNDDIFTSYQLLLRFTLYCMEKYKDKVYVLKILKIEIPDLRFSHGVKQRIHSCLFRYAPHLYMLIMTAIKNFLWRSH